MGITNWFRKKKSWTFTLVDRKGFTKTIEFPRFIPNFEFPVPVTTEASMAHDLSEAPLEAEFSKVMFVWMLKNDKKKTALFEEVV